MPASKIVRRVLPSAAALAKMPGLGWLGRYLKNRPWLWVANRRRVALGAALGLALGVVPVPGQMFIAGAAAVLLRANVAAAVAATWLTNPFTLVPIWALAIWLGKLVLPGSRLQNAPVRRLELAWAHPDTWWPAVSAWCASLGKPLLVGLPLTGVVLGAALYAAVHVGWWTVVVLERRRRLRRRTVASPNARAVWPYR